MFFLSSAFEQSVCILNTSLMDPSMHHTTRQCSLIYMFLLYVLNLALNKGDGIVLSMSRCILWQFKHMTRHGTVPSRWKFIVHFQCEQICYERKLQSYIKMVSLFVEDDLGFFSLNADWIESLTWYTSWYFISG